MRRTTAEIKKSTEVWLDERWMIADIKIEVANLSVNANKINRWKSRFVITLNMAILKHV